MARARTSLDITGGTGGVGAALEDLAAAAQRIAETAADVSLVATVVLRSALSADLVSAALACPVESARLAAGLADLAGPGGLGGEAVALGTLAAGLRSAVAAYAAGEEVVARLVEAAQDAAVLVLSRQAAPLAVAVAAVHRAGVDVGAGADRLVFEAPWLADLAGGVEGAVAGPATPLGYEDALTLLSRTLSHGGRLTEAGRQVQATAEPSRAARAPASLADLLAHQDDLGTAASQPSRVRVVEVPQADGSSSWVVVIPGTQSWSPRAGTNPSDLTSDVVLMAQQSALLAAGVDHALLQAQRDAGREGLADAVMLVGHSQGGIAAAALAADPDFRQRQRVTHVVASGAPIARFPVPPEVSVLAIEHRQDAVPRLEGERNADRRGWVTVTRDLDGEPVDRSAGAAHASGLYRATAALADTSGSHSLADWRRGSAAFLAGPTAGTATVRDFRVARVGGAP